MASALHHSEPDTAVAERQAAIDSTIGAAVSHLLGKRGKITDLAAYIGMKNASSLSRRLSGETPFKASELALVAEFFGKPVGMLYTDHRTWTAPTELSPNVRGPDSQGSLLLPNDEPAFDFDRSDVGLVVASGF